MDQKHYELDTSVNEKAVLNSVDERARRFNGGKTRFDLVDPEFEEGVARVLTFGADKYGEDNWKTSYNTEHHEEFVSGCYASLRRHLHSIRNGEWLDSESGLPHIDHVSCNAMFIRYYEHD